MRTLTASATAALLLLALGACADDELGTEAATPSQDPASVSTAPGGAPDPTELAAARVVAQQFYDAIGPHDCITLRQLSTLAEQQEDDAWADCIDVLLAVAGDDYAYSVQGQVVEGDTATLTVAITSTVDGQPVSREDPIVLLKENGVWKVDDSLVTAG